MEIDQGTHCYSCIVEDPRELGHDRHGRCGPDDIQSSVEIAADALILLAHGTSRPSVRGKVDRRGIVAPSVEQRRLKEAARRLQLENDPWTGPVRPAAVTCRGCGRTVKLDGRSRYYPGQWEKHRTRCKGIPYGVTFGSEWV